LIVENYQSLVDSMLSGVTTNRVASKAIQKVLEMVLDSRWDTDLSAQTPDKFLQELEGIDAGGVDAFGITDCGAVSARGILLANLPGDGSDIVKMLLTDMKPSIKIAADLLAASAGTTTDAILAVLGGMHCDMFACWGHFTSEEGAIYAGRNLDWNKNTGVSKSKMVTIIVPPEPELHAHATFGFAGIWGALAGMSKAGLTVHEANLESKYNTLKGFPWVLRLREVMETASNLDEARKVFESTNNTVGFNHGVSSAPDQAAMVFETDAMHTGYFTDDSEVERAAGGRPFKDAVFRTNHGYDPVTVENYQWSADGHAYQDSLYRYNMFVQFFEEMEATQDADVLTAVNIAAALGTKGDLGTFYECNGDYEKGSNVLSVAFSPGDGLAYAAWEDMGKEGRGWVPACCLTYVMIDFKKYWG
jgi:hypothetical protein